MKLVYVILIIGIAIPSYAQEKGINIRFLPSFDTKNISLEDAYYALPGGDSISFETLKCYISSLAFYWNDSLVYKEQDSYHLLDMANEKSMIIHIATQTPVKYNGLRFNLGIDSITNVSGSQGGDLDPMQGMFWSWQSGYINCKLEGKSNKCHTRNSRFHFHLGGYMSP